MTQTAAAFEATYSDWKVVRGRKVVQIVIEVPLEHSDRAYAVLGGMPNPGEETWVAVARLNLSARPEEPKAIEPPNRYPQRAGILCSDVRFQHFLVERYAQSHEHVGEDLEGWASHKVRQLCGVESRADIKPETVAADKFDRLVAQYEMECR